jgi:hypothetical protein
MILRLLCIWLVFYSLLFHSPVHNGCAHSTVLDNINRTHKTIAFVEAKCKPYYPSTTNLFQTVSFLPIRAKKLQCLFLLTTWPDLLFCPTINNLTWPVVLSQYRKETKISRIKQDFINFFTISSHLRPDLCCQHKYCTNCMKQWRTDIFFQLSEATQLKQKERSNHHFQRAIRNLVSYMALKLPLLPTLPTCFPSLSHHIFLHLHKSSTMPGLLAFNITAVSSQLQTTRQ